ncbi:MAG: PA2778 family cysteine peptidase [Steroidobacteraceae bacterium]
MILARGCVAALLALATGCAALPGRIAWPTPPPRAVELAAVPFFPQRVDQCGPAALATVLAYAGRDVDPDRLRPEVFLPGRRGSLQLEMQAAARRHGLIPYRIATRMPAIAAALADGRPVLVMQNLAIPSVPYWHYAVVVGLDPAAGRVLLRSGRDRRHRMGEGRFDDSWRWAGRWGLVMLEPGGAIPEWAEQGAYLEAVAALEALPATRAAAGAAYLEATRRWPQAPLAWLGLGNVEYAADRRLAARDAWWRAAGLAPDSAPIRNNLATVRGALGCREAALAAAPRAVELAGEGPFAAAARATLAEVARGAEASGDAATACQATANE